MVCACPRTNPVVMISGRMVCWFCGNQRLPKPVDAADRLLYGPISQYVEGPTRRLYEIYQGRECMLELAGILYQLIGPCARNNSPSVMISCVGALNGCLRDLDRVPGSGLVRFVRTWGPVLGAHGYVSPLHVARDYFEGATYAIVTPTQYRGEERPLDSLPYDDVAGHVYQYSTNTITETEKHVMWTPGVTPGTEMCPLDKISFAASVLAAFPANLVARKSWIGARRGTLRVETNPEDCTLSFEHGKCWAQLFPDAKNELSIASCFGYQLPIGVQGKYIARRLQINGLKLVLADGGQWTAYTFHKGSWLGHIQPSHEPLPDEVHALATFNVVPYNEPSRLPLYKLPGRVYFGGSRYSCMASDPSWQDFLLPGFCWTQLFPMRYRVEEARLAIQRQQQSSEGVTGTYLMGRLLVRGIKAVESPTGTLYVYQSIAWPSVRHISIIPSNHSGVLVARLEITSLADPRDLFGFGPHWYGKRKRGGGSKSSDPAACDWGKAVEEQEKQLPQPQGEARPPSERIASSVAPAVPQRKAKKSKSSPPESANVTFGAPDDAKEKTTPAQPSNIREALVRPVVGTDNRIQISSKPGLPNQVFVPPPDGGCGLHAVQAIACHYRTGKWPEQSAKVCWDEKKWTDSDQLAELIGALHLPAGLDMGSGCSHCRYVISLESDHWVVFYYDNRPAAFSSCCAAGACASAVGTLAGMESPTWYDPSGVYDLLPCIESPEEYCNVVCGLVPRASLTKPRPVLRQRVLASLAVRPANEPAKVPCSYVREIHSKSDLNDCIPPKPNEAPCPASTDAIEKAQAAQEIARDTVAPDKPVGRAPFLLRATSYLQQHAAAASSRVFQYKPHLLAALSTSSGSARSPMVYVGFGLFSLGFLLVGLSPLASILLGCCGLLFCFTSRTGITMFASLVCVSILNLVLRSSSPLCENRDDDCVAYLHQLRDRYDDPPSVYLTPGPFTAFFAFIRWLRFVSLRPLLVHCILLLLDSLLLLLILLSHKVCRHCWRRCIRLAPEEIVLPTIPSSRTSRAVLLDIADAFAPPPVDVIRLATGYSGCFRGVLPAVGVGSGVISCDAIDTKKVRANTLCSMPSTPAEAVKAIHVLSARGQLAYQSNCKVEKVEKLPCRNPIFEYDVNSRNIVTVDAKTFELLRDLGCDTSHLIIGSGDFFEVMGVKRPDRLGVALMQARRISGGGILHFRPLLALAWVLFFIFLGLWFQSSHACGVGTSDPFCKGSFGVPIVQQQDICDSGFCGSPFGVSRSLVHYLTPDVSVAPYLVLAITVAYLLLSYVPGLLETVCLLINAVLPTSPLVTVIRVICFQVALPHLTQRGIVIFTVTCALIDIPSLVTICILAISAWVLGKYTGVGGLVTPYDIRNVVKTARDSVAVANAPPNTYLGAVRRAALTGGCVYYIADNTGIVLEGLLREKTPAPNAVRVFGKTTGTGALLRKGGKTVCISAQHVTGEGKAIIRHNGVEYEAQFATVGDFAEAEVQIPGSFPEYKLAPPTYSGRAYWLCNDGVEVGFVTPQGCVVFSGPGDSGSAIITPESQLIGIHTGSDSKGCGAYTTPDGSTITGAVSLSHMTACYEGPSVSVPERLPRNVTRDVDSVPQPLATILQSSINLEGSLGTIQLVVLCCVLWRYFTNPMFVPFVAAFFVLNEILPKCLTRGIYNCALWLLAVFTPLGSKVLFIRLTTAALNRNATALFCHLGFAGIALLADFIILGDYELALSKCSFYILPVNAPSMHSVVIILAVTVVVCLLDVFGYRRPAVVMSCSGSFDPVFLSRYIHEGVKNGVSATIATESLSTALATTLSADDLKFLDAIAPCKAIVSAINVNQALNDYVLSNNSKRLRAALSAVHAHAGATKALASLDKFLTGHSTKLSASDPVLLLGNPKGDVVPIFTADAEYIAKPIRTHRVAGTNVTLCEVVAQVESSPVTLNNKYLTVAGKLLPDHPDFKAHLKPENDAKISQMRDDMDKKLHSKKIDIITVGGRTYDKYWNTVTGDVWYEVVSPEGDSSVSTSSQLYDLDSAASAMGLKKDLSAREIARLQDIIGKLQALTKTEALNLLTASGCTSADRSGLVISLDSAQLISHHDSTRAYNGIDFKIVDQAEFDRTVRLSPDPQPAVARLKDGHIVIFRKHPPSLCDVLTKGMDAEYQVPIHGPGDTGIDGYLWDFAHPPSKEGVELSAQIIAACAARRGAAPACYPYRLEPVAGDPYREGNVLKNTRFGDVQTTTVADNGDPWLKICAMANDGCPVVSDGKVVATTLPLGSEVYLPTLPESVLEYLDSRPDCPTYFTQHGTEAAALKDLQKFNLSTQGFILPGVLAIVRKYLLKNIGYQPAIYTPATVPSNDSHAGINGLTMSTKMLQALPDINELCERACSEVWQAVTPVTLKKQYCGKMKTRTILGTNALISLALRAALSGVTKAFQLAGKGSPICLGKSKFHPMHTPVRGRCLETDLASCDRSTPAIVRHFATELLFELGCCPRMKKLYIANCCHDLLVTQTTACTKRGGLSSGDPVTSIANTIYSLVLYTQHMVLSCLENGRPEALRYLQHRLTLEELLAIQPVIVYSDDLVLIDEPENFPNFSAWVPHLELALGFKVDPKKTVVTTNPGFLGCHVYDERWLVPQKERVLAALAYHMNATTATEYYSNAVSILCDASALSFFEQAWFNDLVVGLAECAIKDGHTFPGPSYFYDFFQRVSGYTPEGDARVCGVCLSTAQTTSDCGLDLCALCAHRHVHGQCTVKSPFCGHKIGSKQCRGCSLDVVPLNTPFGKLLEQDDYHPAQPTVVDVLNGFTSAPPGRYQYQKKIYMLKRERDGCPLDLPDGEYLMKRLPNACSGIKVPTAQKNACLSTFIVGPPGAGKTTAICRLLDNDSVVYCPTHVSFINYSKALPAARFTVPRGQDPALYGTPSDHGPRLQLLSSGYIHASKHFLDEACYSNPFDMLKLLSLTPITAIGDPRQLSPVGFDGPAYVFDLMKRQQLTTIYRFGPNVCSAIQKFYESPLQSARQEDTAVIYQEKFSPRGLVITPYHRDRVGDAVTVDSAQGATKAVVTLYLPSRNSLTPARALVAITRATDRLYIYDPHNQLQKFVDLPSSQPTRTPHAFVRNGDVVVSLAPGVELSAMDLPGLCCTANPKSDEDRQILEKSQLKLDIRKESGSLCPLPRVAHNLGFYYSPDLPKLLHLPEELAPHWPVCTAKNREDWPNRLVVTINRLCPLSQPATCAGYYVGDSLFCGSPGVVSYWLTQFLDGKAVPIPDSLFSTGRIEQNLRCYLSDEERRFAEAHPHAFIGDTKGTTVGGCHHITSQYLPDQIPAGGVVKVGVSSPGKAFKSCCTLTDVYLPLLSPYTEPPTQSKVYQVRIDNKLERLMVWRDRTMYFQEGRDPLALADAVASVRVQAGLPIRVESSCSPTTANRPLAIDRNDEHVSLAIGVYGGCNADMEVSLSDPFEMPSDKLCVNAVSYLSETIIGSSLTTVYYYIQAESHDRDPKNLPDNVAYVLRSLPRYRRRATKFSFVLSPPACHCQWAIQLANGTYHCKCNSTALPQFLEHCRKQIL
ncbi:putative 1b protein [Pebjah virus]|uniref:Replicase polyprotein 1ab n=1 Tax=Pebjah virus TaxID=1658615 RepID=A0A0G2UPV3_9NIDO|nr:putative 1b protein [Pebjah virus]AKI29941.1 putative 1b protein [Pebjah virus]